MTTETIDRLYLELSQFTAAKTSKEIELEKDSARLKYLVSWWFGFEEPNGSTPNLRRALRPRELIAMIDAAIAAAKEN